MKKNSLRGIVIFISMILFIGNTTSMYSSDIIEKIKITVDEIPDGYMFGQVPEFAKGILKNNPWNFDKDAIKKFTDRIYPGADYRNISEIHMTIIASKNKPLGNDIGCYIMIYKNGKAAKDELKKLNEFIKYNSDRGIIIEKNNIAVYLYINDVKNYDHIKRLSEIIKKKLETI
ncbi:MAG: hypothetical protein FWF73_01745 [Spirochaetes bacterium]|nr:hypothetical protein [Spirochaetota bacterium]